MSEIREHYASAHANYGLEHLPADARRYEVLYASGMQGSNYHWLASRLVDCPELVKVPGVDAHEEFRVAATVMSHFIEWKKKQLRGAPNTFRQLKSRGDIANMAVKYFKHYTGGEVDKSWTTRQITPFPKLHEVPGVEARGEFTELLSVAKRRVGGSNEPTIGDRLKALPRDKLLSLYRDVTGARGQATSIATPAIRAGIAIKARNDEKARKQVERFLELHAD